MKNNIFKRRVRLFASLCVFIFTELLLPVTCFASGHIFSISGTDIVMVLSYPIIIVYALVTFGCIMAESLKAAPLYVIQLIVSVVYFIEYISWRSHGDADTSFDIKMMGALGLLLLMNGSILLRKRIKAKSLED